MENLLAMMGKSYILIGMVVACVYTLVLIKLYISKVLLYHTESICTLIFINGFKRQCSKEFSGAFLSCKTEILHLGQNLS